MKRIGRTAGGACAALFLGLATTHGIRAQPAAPPRIAPRPSSQWSREARDALAAFAPVDMPNLAATYANHPELAAALLPHLRYLLTDSTLPARGRDLLALRTAWLTRSDYLWAHAAAAARRDGLTGGELERVARGPDAAGWMPFDAALLRAADELHVDAFVSDATWAALSARYDLRQMIDAVDTVGALTMHAGAANSLDVPIEPSATARPPAGLSRAAAAERTNERLIGARPRIPPVQPKDGARASANVFNTFVRNPRADRLRGAVNAHVNSRSTLSPLQRELLLVRIGVLCRAEYEYAAHLRVGRRVGMTDEDVALILAGPERGKGDPVKLALLRAVDELHGDDAVSASTWRRLAETLDTRQLLDVLIAVGAYRSGSMLINSAGVQLDASMAEFRFPPSMR